MVFCVERSRSTRKKVRLGLAEVAVDDEGVVGFGGDI